MKFKCLSLSFMIWPLSTIPGLTICHGPQHAPCWINPSLLCRAPLWLYPNCSVAGQALPPLFSHPPLSFSRHISAFQGWVPMSPLCETMRFFCYQSSGLSQQLVHFSNVRLTKTGALMRYVRVVIKTRTKVYLNRSDFRTYHGTRHVAGIINQNARILESPRLLP